MTAPNQVVKTLLNPLAGEDRPHMIFARSENVKILVCAVWGRWRRYSLRTYAVDQINRPILTKVRIGYVAMSGRAKAMA
jgi:hypothetical protein